MISWPRRSQSGISSASAGNGSGNDLHCHANYPSQHYHYCPKDVRIFTRHNHTDRCKSRQRSEECADGTEKFCRINFSAGAASWRLTIWSMKSQRGSINSQVERNCAANHHNDYKILRSEHRDGRADMGGNKQSACRSGHRKPNAFQEVGNFPYAGSHHRIPTEGEDNKLGHFGSLRKFCSASSRSVYDAEADLARTTFGNVRSSGPMA